MEDGVEVYPRQGKSIFPHQKYRLSFWTVGIFLCAEDGVEVYPRQGKSIFHHQKYRLSFWMVGIFLCEESKERYETEYWLELFQRAGIADLTGLDPLRRASGTIRRTLIASVNTAKKNRT